MVVLIDNYDSFTYNLVQLLGELGVEVEVLRNDAVSAEQVLMRRPSHIVISPGPGHPSDAGITPEIFAAASGRVPILGVCLGEQALGLAYGAKVVRAPVPVHGKASLIHHNGASIFRNLPNPFPATRYHSLVVERETLPECLFVNAWTDDGLVMGLSHADFPYVGVQFHPESILTTCGHDLVRNFLQLTASGQRISAEVPA